MSRLYISSNPRGNTAICASYWVQVQMDLHKTAGLKKPPQSCCVPPSEMEMEVYAAWKLWCLGEQKHLKHNIRQTEQDLTEKGLGIRCQSRSSNTCLDSISMRSDTDQIITCLLRTHHLSFHQNLLRQGMTTSEGKGWDLW